MEPVNERFHWPVLVYNFGGQGAQERPLCSPPSSNLERTVPHVLPTQVSSNITLHLPLSRPLRRAHDSRKR